MERILLWLFCGVVSGIVASRKLEPLWGWILLGVVLGPLALIASLLIGRDEEAIEKQKLSSGQWIKCPQCAELIKPEA